MKTLLKGAVAALTSLSMTAPAFANCFSLEQFVQQPGPFYGTSIQLDGNTVLSLVPSQFWWDPATPATTPPNAEMLASNCFGASMGLFLNNTNLTVFIHQREPNVKSIQMNFCDHGGHENVAANNANPPEFIGDIPNIPGVLMDPFMDPVQVVTSLAPPEGKLVFEATGAYLDYMRAGGQEFIVSGFCIN